MELRNNTTFEFTDISSEIFRSYRFPSGNTVTIQSPTHLSVSSSGGHRILDEEGVSHYIPQGWIHLWWKVKDDQPHFVK